MKKNILIIISMLCNFYGNAQNFPHYTQYVTNQYVINPALSGIENYTDIKLGYRHQWQGLNGAPRASYLTAHGALNKNDFKTSATGFKIPGENPRGKNYWEDYEAAAPHHGVGVSVQNMKAGFFNFLKAKASYAYHVGISPKATVSVGAAAGINQVSINADAVKFNNPLDPSLGNTAGQIKKLKPELDLGVYMYHANYFVGLSAMQVLPQKFRFNDNQGNYGDKLKMHAFATAGYRFQINDDINVIPSIMAKYVPNTPTSQFDINVKAQYQDLLWAAGSYRFKYGYTGMVGANIGNTLNIGYSYDYTNTYLNQFSSGTHEIVLGFIIGNKYGDWCPRNVW